MADQGEARASYRVFVVHHTHWDREWWATYQDFRIRLVELIDDLLDTIEADPGFRTFLLDAQTIVLRDYLEIRPENQDRLVQAMREGRIECGPWHVLSDEFLVSGEAQIRNLWLARRVARDLGCPLLSSGYLPDTFGHIAQMPQILRGFGFDNALVWRGRGGAAETVKAEFLWESPDGSSVLTHWFPNGYYQMPFLHFDHPERPYEDRVGRVFTALTTLGARATTDALLLPYGGDHCPSDRSLARKIGEANQAEGSGAHFSWGTIAEFMTAVRAAHPDLETVKGELRTFGPETPHLLPGVLSSRLYLKELNARGQTWLERYAEPLSATAWLAGWRYDAALLWTAWELLIQNHPHDSICGCSIDQVHREMISRFDASRQIAEISSEKAVQFLNARIDTSALAGDDRALVVHNTLPRRRGGWCSVWIERDDVRPTTHILLDDRDVEHAFQVRSAEGPRPMSDRWLYTKIGFRADEVPGLGYRTYRLSRRAVPLRATTAGFQATGPVARDKGSEAVTDLRVGTNLLENSRLRVEVDPHGGALTVTDKRSGEVYEGLNTFEDGGDAGDEYNYSAPPIDLVLESWRNSRVHVSATELGHARATLRIDVHWALPERLTDDRTSRSDSYLDTCISTYVTLISEGARVDIVTEWENRSQDHRLRVLFPLGTPVESVNSQNQFVVTERPIQVGDAGHGWPEPFVTTAPQQNWSAIEAGKRGMLVANRGLPEFEVLDDQAGTLAVTLLRAIGWLSRDDLTARVGGAGPTLPTPDAQMLGPNRASYSIIPYAGDVLQSRVYELAEEYEAPLYGSATGIHSGDAPATHSTVEMTGDHTLLLSACKKAEDREELILRFWNMAHVPTTARVRVTGGGAARLLTLAEEVVSGGDLPMDSDGRFEVRARGAEIATVGVVQLEDVNMGAISRVEPH